MNPIVFYPESLSPKVPITEKMKRACEWILDCLVDAGIASDDQLSSYLERLSWIARARSSDPRVMARLEKEYEDLERSHYWVLIGECGFLQWFKGNWKIAIRNAKHFIDTLQSTPDFLLVNTPVM